MPPTDAELQTSTLIDRLYGGLVPVDGAPRARLLHRSLPSAWPDSQLESWRLEVGEPAWVSWTLQLWRPRDDTPVPVLVTGDACWGLPDEATRARFAASGVALAWFNRVELAADAPEGARAGPVFERFPGVRCGALSVWAWGLSCAADALRHLPDLNPLRVGVVGHSRGGKAALLAGAANPRIDLTVAHNSGVAGAASSFRRGPGAESIDALVQAFPHWLACDVEGSLEAGVLADLDQDVLLAGIAPRRLCLIQARDDAWANPSGVEWVFRRARAAWERAGHACAIELRWRDGGHPMGPWDWDQALEALVRTAASEGPTQPVSARA